MIKIFFALFAYLFVVSSTALLAQQSDPLAAEILQKVEAKYKGYKSYKVAYIRTIENAKGKVQSTENSVVWISGSSFHIINSDVEIICNGSIMWNINSETKEVNIYDYDAENDELNPTRIFNIYKSGYKYAMVGEVADGKVVLQNIELEPEDRKKDIAKIRVVLNKADKTIKIWKETEDASPDSHPIDMRGWTKQSLQLKRF
jgi:outer membrane lipoprotein-sorting protein